ncbi:hypothetical protein COHA_000487 [Chlorella ohadii]|uniref:Uncharacterized protein n=1 Tax=Chlorella ohadii TaxID=2649997 RepID=A0AAD5E0I8_9CHLO|nr:hypothetical protein COHA_000487 [Chlorella ohadii]
MCRAVAPDTQAYLQGLGPLAPTARPSVLQPLAQRRGGTHAPSLLARTRLGADGTHLADLLVDGAGQLLPVQGGVAQCHLELGAVKGVPPSGVKDRKVDYHATRACLYDGARFHGSVLLYVELNVAHELLPEEAESLPTKHAAQQVTEVCVAYAMLDLFTLPTLHAARSLSVPLRGGPLALRWTLPQCAAAAAAAHAATPKGGKAAQPKHSAKAGLSFTLKPVPPQDTAAALLPRLALASAPVARVVSLYRQLLAETLGMGSASLAPAADPVLAAFPGVLDDEDLSDAFLQLWRQELRHSTATGAPPATAAELRAAFRRCATVVWAGWGAQAVPPPTCSSHTTHRVQRRMQLQQFATTPAASLGSSAWLHRPFDCRELRTGGMEGLAATV